LAALRVERAAGRADIVVAARLGAAHARRADLGAALAGGRAGVALLLALPALAVDARSAAAGVALAAGLAVIDALTRSLAVERAAFVVDRAVCPVGGAARFIEALPIAGLADEAAAAFVSRVGARRAGGQAHARAADAELLVAAVRATAIGVGEARLVVGRAGGRRADVALTNAAAALLVHRAVEAVRVTDRVAASLVGEALAGAALGVDGALLARSEALRPAARAVDAVAYAAIDVALTLRAFGLAAALALAERGAEGEAAALLHGRAALARRAADGRHVQAFSRALAVLEARRVREEIEIALFVLGRRRRELRAHVALAFREALGPVAPRELRAERLRDGRVAVEIEHAEAARRRERGERGEA